jgi:Mg-chelatase subunit ChlD
MEYERLPSGVFFTIANPQVDVQPFVVNQQYDRASDDFVRPNFASVADSINRSSGTNLPLRQRREFRIAQHVVDTKDDRRYLPLLEVSLDIKVVATVSRTALKQTFSNHSDITIKEATYCFPLYDGSAVVEFRAWIGQDRLLEGKIKPKDVAKAEFQEAVSRQRAAVLLEELTPEVFETSLGNIPAHTTVKVEIHYINELKADLGGDGVLVTVPTSVAPRYGTPPQDYSRASTSSSIVTPEENGLTIQVEVSAPVPIRKLESRTHPISVELGGEGHPVAAKSFRDLASASASSTTAGFDSKKARATLSDRTTTLGKDFVLLILAADATILASRALIEHIPNRPDHSALMVTINPRELFGSNIAVENVRAEILFIADRSGSMIDKIEALKRAMRIFLKSIPENCYFNICSFGSSYSLLWPEARRYTQENQEIAERHIRDSFEANMGGTEILSAIKTVVEKRNTGDGITTEVIVLTDGEVWDTDDTIKFVQETRTKTDNNVRFFALGIGNAVSHRLVEGIGRQGGGFAEVIAVDTAGRWESRVIRMLKGALTPRHWNCEILVPNATLKSAEDAASRMMPIQRPAALQAPNQIPTLHAFRRTSIYFLVDTQLMGQTTSITVQTVTVSGQKIQMEIPLEKTDAKPLTIHHLAAKALMNDLETGQSWMHADKYQEYQKKDPTAFEQAVKSEAEKIGMEWSIVGKWTSFVAVDNNDQIEQKTRIYRAERSELADLMRPRHFGSTSTSSAPPFLKMPSNANIALPPPCTLESILSKYISLSILKLVIFTSLSCHDMDLAIDLGNHRLINCYSYLLWKHFRSFYTN